MNGEERPRAPIVGVTELRGERDGGDSARGLAGILLLALAFTGGAAVWLADELAAWIIGAAMMGVAALLAVVLAIGLR